ncbi:MAG: DUF1624 domain-containing protein [Bacteroidetes bacterium]|nr:DUF1624 domain-containing protein [Bacteroidota bacterium]
MDITADKQCSTELNKKKQSSRIPSLDIARLLAMLMMVQGHTIYCLLDTNIINSGLWYWNTWTFIRGITAPVFLMVSGAVHIFANKRNEYGKIKKETIKKRFKTCGRLLIIGYLMQFPVSNLFDLPFIDINSWYAFFKVNVLQMFAASISILTILYIVTRKNSTLAIISFILGNIIIFSSPFVLTIKWFDILPIPFASFLSMEHRTIFPIFPFTAYLLIGTTVGYLVQKQPQERRTFYIATRLLIGGIFYILLSYLFKYTFCINLNADSCLSQSPISPVLIIMRVGLAMLAISVAAWICLFFEKLKNPKWWISLENIIGMFSKRALFIYVIHLIVIYGSPISPGIRHFFYQADVFTALYCAFFVIFITMLIVYIYDKTFSKIHFMQFYKYLIVALLIYMLFI